MVPTGNFGNILAAYYAKKMGLPVDKLICASNCKQRAYRLYPHRTFTIATGTSIPLCSPSMDILISSNLERLLYDMTGGNDAFGGLLDERA